MVDCEYYPCHFQGQDCRWCYCPFYPCLDPSTGGKYKDRKEKSRVWSCINCHWVHKKDVARAIEAKIGDKKLSHDELLRSRMELLEDG